MTTEQWERAKEVTADALELEPGARSEFIVAACGGDVHVEREVLRLVAGAESSSTDFLSSPALRLPSLLEHRFELSPTFSRGQIVAGRFRIERFVSRGGMGEVYVAMDLELREIVALKTIRSAIAYSPAVIEKFKREVSQSRRVTHPNVCRVYDMFSHEEPSRESQWFLTMEFLDGPTLGERIAAAGPQRTDLALPLIRNVVAGVAAAHDLGIVHRDLKPNNVMLVKNGSEPERAVVTDFGLALKLSTVEAGVDAGAGTPAYMAPEQTTGDNVGLAADQYALGLLICQMLTGTCPELDRISAGESRRQLKTWLTSQPRRAIDARTRRVVWRCLQFLPEDRFPNVRDLLPVIDGSHQRSRLRRMAAAGIAALIAGMMLLASPDWKEQVADAVPLTSETGMSSSPSVSANGKWVAYISDRGEPGNMDIWIQPTAGGQARRLTTNPAIEAEPAASPDGKLIAFRSEREGGGLYSVAADGSGERLLVRGGMSPAFSPDGRWIAYWTGLRDDTAGTGELYKIPSGGGASVRLAEGFADARYPAWSPDGRFILFEGCQSNLAALTTCNDWWIMRSDGTGIVNSGALAAVKSQTIALQTPPAKSWRGDEVIFSGARGSATALWTLQLSGATHRPAGPARQITPGDARERDPSAASDGTIAFARGTAALHVWRISLQQTGSGQQSRITNDAGIDGCPSVSRDGRWLFIARKVGDVRQLVARDLSTGQESRLLSSGDDKFWPVSSPSGDEVAVESRGVSADSIWIAGHDGKGRRLCTGCSHPTSWFAGTKAVLYATSKGEIAELDAASGRSRIILSPANGVVMGGADWNPAHEYLLFTASRHGGTRRTFAIRYPSTGTQQAAGTHQGEWIPISPGDVEMEQPHWSGDGATIYFLSKADGNNCVWGIRFDAAHRRTTGEPFPVMHYHDPRLTPDRTSPISRGLTVSADAVFLNIGEVTTTLWAGRLTASPWIDAFRWLSNLSFAR